MAKGFDIANRAKPRRADGFTIVELLLATAVFSLVLLAALGSFLQIGRLFYKGVSLTNTQNVATSVMNDINNSMQTTTIVSSSTPYTSGTYDYVCVGSNRYTFTTHDDNGKQIANVANFSTDSPNYASGESGTFGLLKDILPGNAGCSAPCASAAGCLVPLSAKSTEMLGDQMRIADFEISQANSTPNLYNVNLVVAYGNDSVFDFSNPQHPACNGGSASQAFCSVINLSTSVFAGTHT